MNSRYPCLAIQSPGDMGHAIARELRANGVDVVACLQGRSQRTCDLAERAGIRVVDDWQTLVNQADIVLSILVPAAARQAAIDFAEVIPSVGGRVHYVDCNAIAPATVKEIATVIEIAGADFSDASIIGLPPGATSMTPRLYVSGPKAEELSVFHGLGIEVMILGQDIGAASAIKACYAGLTKATFALHYAATVVAHRAGLLDDLIKELEFSQPEMLAQMERQLPRLPTKSHRWVGEMEEIAKAFEAADVTADFHLAAAAIFRLVSQSSFAMETPESVDLSRGLRETIQGISDSNRT